MARILSWEASKTLIDGGEHFGEKFELGFETSIIRNFNSISALRATSRFISITIRAAARSPLAVRSARLSLRIFS